MKFIASGQNCGNKYKYIKWHDDFRWFNKKGNPMVLSTNSYYMINFTFMTYDGTMYMLDCNDQVLVDVNGFRKPNKIGKDIYFFILNSKTNQPYYPSSVNVLRCYNNNYTKSVAINDANYREDCKSGSGWGCSRMIINNEQ